jgi:hypothetical protein
MTTPFPSSLERRRLAKWLGVLAAAMALGGAGCGGDDYYFINEIKGEGDTVLFEFLFTCGKLDITWDGSFGAPPKHRIELAVKHDASGECAEDRREVPFDVGPMKRSFRTEHPWPEPLGLRVPPYEEEQGAICLANLFQDGEFKGTRCK